MLLLHLGIPPSGHGYAPPIAVAVITVLAKKGLYSAEMHLRVYYSSAPSLSKKLSVNGEKTVLASQSAQRKHLSGAFKLSKEPPAPTPTGGTELRTWRSTFFFSFFTNPEFPFQKPVIARLLHFPRFPAISSQKEKEERAS